MPPPGAVLEQAIRQTIRNAAEKIADEEIAEAQKRIEQRVRAKSVEIGARFATQMDFARSGPDLVVSIRFPANQS